MAVPDAQHEFYMDAAAVIMGDHVRKAMQKDPLSHAHFDPPKSWSVDAKDTEPERVFDQDRARAIP